MTPRNDAAHAADEPGLKGGYGDYDLVIASMPWLDVQLRGITRHELRTELHHAKTLQCIRLTKPGGLIAVLANHSLMDRAPAEARAAISREASFLGAIRFPAGVLREQAGTDDIIDLLLLAKPESGAPDTTVPFTNAVQVTVDRFVTTINQYFDDHPEHVLGSIYPEVQIWNTSDFTIQGDGRDAMMTEYRQALHAIVGHAISTEMVPQPAAVDPNAPQPGGWVISGARRYLPDALRDAGIPKGVGFVDRPPEPPPPSIDL